MTNDAIAIRINEYKAQMKELETQYQRLVGAVAALEALTAPSAPVEEIAQ